MLLQIRRYALFYTFAGNTTFSERLVKLKDVTKFFRLFTKSITANRLYEIREDLTHVSFYSRKLP